MSYAMDHGRRYPYRPAVEWAQDRAILLYHALRPDLDERNIIRPYISINGHLLDPLTAKVDLDNSDPTISSQSNIALWYGWQYTNTGVGERGMKKLGDRFTYTIVGSGDQAAVYSFDVLVGDWDGTYVGGNNISTHPDHEQVMYDWVVDGKDPFAEADPVALRAEIPLGRRSYRGGKPDASRAQFMQKRLRRVFSSPVGLLARSACTTRRPS